MIKLEIGGQIFEICSSLLKKDRFSLLAACCIPEEDSVLRPSEDGCFYFDRDWFLFRHILSFLQSGDLPRDVTRLRELYHEAGFFCLGSLQRCIETVLADIDNVSPYDNEPKYQKNEASYNERSRYKNKIHDKKTHKVSKTTKAASASRDRRRREQAKKVSLVAPKLPDPYGFTSQEGKKSYYL